MFCGHINSFVTFKHYRQRYPFATMANQEKFLVLSLVWWYCDRQICLVTQVSEGWCGSHYLHNYWTGSRCRWRCQEGQTKTRNACYRPSKYSCPAFWDHLLSWKKCGLKLKVALKLRDIYIECFHWWGDLKILGQLENGGVLNLQGPLQWETLYGTSLPQQSKWDILLNYLVIKVLVPT